jgi:hypothetical protein
MIEEANKKFQTTGLFKMQFFSGWNVFVLRQDYIADLRGSRDKDLSLYHAQNDVSPQNLSLSLALLPSWFQFGIFVRYLLLTTPSVLNHRMKTICTTKSSSACWLRIFLRTGMSFFGL